MQYFKTSKLLMFTICWIVTIIVSCSIVPRINALADRQESATASRFTSEQLLADALMRQANMIVQKEPFTVSGGNIARELYSIAHELQPEDPDILRKYLDLAAFIQDDALRSELIQKLTQLQPRNQVVRLERMIDVMNRYQTADERADALEKLIANDNVDSLGQPVASRLAVDLALIYQRQGNVLAVGEWLGRATAIDQSNKQAASLAAGYFDRQVSDDPFARTELLVNLLMADPTDLTTLTALATHLLEHGAYEGAARMYELAVEGHQPARQPISPNLAADLIIAQWGAGQIENAHRTLREFRRQIDELTRMQAFRENPELSIAERGKITGDLPPTLGAVQLALDDHVRSDPDRLAASLAALTKSFRLTLDRQRETPLADSDRSEILLSIAVLQLWFGNDAELAQNMINEASQLSPLNETADTRFKGWLAMRRGDLPTARALLEPIAGRDELARLALAMTYIEENNMRQGARELLAVARTRPGSVMGIWSRYQLQEILGKKVPVGELAMKMERVVRSIPSTIDRWPTSPTQMVSFRVEPVKSSFDAYEPVRLRVRVSNNSGMPLGIGPDGPIHRIAILSPKVNAVGFPEPDSPTMLVINIARQLRLDSGSDIDFEVDLRRTSFGAILNQIALVGGSIELSATLNPISAANGSLASGPLGSTFRSSVFRVNGANASDAWLDETAEALENPAGFDDLRRLALVMQLSSGQFRINNLSQDKITAVTDVMWEAFAKLSPVEQAWLMLVVPQRTDSLEPMLQMVRTTTDPILQIVYLISEINEADDPMLQAALRSENARVKRVSQEIARLIERRENLLKQRDKQTDIFDTSGSSGGNDTNESNKDDIDD